MDYFFNSREEASTAAAKHIAGALGRQLDSQPTAAMVVTGGSSPTNCYAALADTDLPWGRIHILLSDERWVPPTDDDSNEKLVRNTLLVNNAAPAAIHPYYDKDATVESRCDSFTEALLDLPRPFACSLLGMGEDGHIASLFADAENFESGIDADGTDMCIPVRTAASPHARISLTLAALLQSDEVVLLFYGESKRKVLERARLSSTAYPVSRLLHQERAPVHVFWAP